MSSQHRDLDPFFAVNPLKLQTLMREVSARSGYYTVACPGINGPKGSECSSSLVKEGLNDEGTRVMGQRAEGQLSLVSDVAAELEEVQATFYSHDVPWQFVGHEYVSDPSVTSVGKCS